MNINRLWEKFEDYYQQICIMIIHTFCSSRILLLYGRYVVIKKLGWGHFSTVWMVKDRQLARRSTGQSSSSNKLFYAIKVQKSAEHYTEAAMDEVELLDCVAKERKKIEALQSKSANAKDKDGIPLISSVDHSRHVATLHDHFFHTGPNGRHMCMVFSMLGCNLLSVIKAYNYRGIPIPVVKKMIKGISKGLDFLHRKCNIIHTDLKPENVLLQFPGQINAENDVLEDQALKHHQQDSEKAVSIADLEAALQNPHTPTEERKKIRKKLKKRRQRERRRFNNDSDDESSQMYIPQNSLSDDAMELMSSQNNLTSTTTRNAHERVLSRLSHSQFVMSNFTPRISAGGDLSQVIDDMVKVSRPSKAEVNAHFQLCSSQIGTRQRPGSAGNGSGVAEVSFLLRAFVPEGEIADNISTSLSGIPWEMGEEKHSTREW